MVMVSAVESDEAVDHMRGWLDLRALPGHWSAVLLHQLAAHARARTLNTFAVLDEIGRLQGTWHGNVPRQPEQFKHEPLKGLWKQHFFQASFLIRNLMNEAHSPESAQTFQEMADAINSGGDVGKSVHDLIIGGYTRRAAAGTLTGEWIVFAKGNAGQNFFLTLARHTECERMEGEPKEAWRRRSDEAIYARVRACQADFPDLSL